MASGATRRPVAVPDEGEMVPSPPLTVEDVPSIPEPAPPAPPKVEPTPEQSDPNAEMWPSGPTAMEVLEWKNLHGSDSVYVTSISPTNHVVWRTLTRFEYRRLVKTLEQSVATGTVSSAEANLNNEEQICEICVLHPKFTRQQLAGELAGLPSVIAQEVMEASAFVSLEVRQL